MTAAFQRRRPGDDALRWAAAQFGPGAEVVAQRRMTGGIASAVHRLTISGNGGRWFVVLRQHEHSQWRSLVEQEAFALDRLAGTSVPAPALATYTGFAQRTIPTQVAGRLPVDTAGMTGRVERLMRGCLARM